MARRLFVVFVLTNHKTLKFGTKKMEIRVTWFASIVLKLTQLKQSGKEGRVQNRFLAKSLMFDQICCVLNTHLDFWPKVWFVTKIWIFGRNLNFWPKFRFLTKKFDFWTHLLCFEKKFRFLTKIWIFDQKFDLWPKFQFLTKISIFEQKFDFWTKI